jgi:carboxyl-terminal processing protease
MREADLERHLSNPTDKDEEASKPAATQTKEGESEPKKAAAGAPEFGSKSDYQLNQALNLLKGLQIISRK